MSQNGNGHIPKIHYLATLGCCILGLTAMVGEIVCRLNSIDTPLSFSTLVGVCIGALAGAVPSHPTQHPHRHNSPLPHPPSAN
jgi:hypothetical protein